MVKVASNLGRGAILNTLDLHSAYKKVPVHQADHHLLGSQVE